MNQIRIDVNSYNQVIQHLEDGKKIQAIKCTRLASGSGLREAKLAVERLAHEKGITSMRGTSVGSPDPEAPKIICGPLIKKVVLDYGSGDIEVDLEEMQMMALMDLQKIGLDVCRDLLDVVDVLQALSEGKKFAVVEKSDEEEEH